MTIDIQEAIRCYHEAAGPRRQEHVILILDKSLHMFPWESLPCLRGRSVSRLPSLGSLVERTIDSPSEGAQWPSVTPNRGFFVLNPSGDLSDTQSRFENTLSRYPSTFDHPNFRMHGWNGIVGRVPMDQEILSALRTNDIFLFDSTLQF
jgi:separase